MRMWAIRGLGETRTRLARAWPSMGGFVLELDNSTSTWLCHLMQCPGNKRAKRKGADSSAVAVSTRVNPMAVPEIPKDGGVVTISAGQLWGDKPAQPDSKDWLLGCWAAGRAVCGRFLGDAAVGHPSLLPMRGAAKSDGSPDGTSSSFPFATCEAPRYHQSCRDEPHDPRRAVSNPSTSGRRL